MMKSAIAVLFLVIIVCEAKHHSVFPTNFEGWIKHHTQKIANIPNQVELGKALVQLYESDELKTIFSNIEEFESVAAAANISHQCKEDAMYAIKHFGPWTINLIDAMFKPSPSVQKGATHWVGGFHQCMTNPPPKNYSGTGSPPRSHYCRQTFGKPTMSPLAPGGVSIDIGLCVPKTCSEKDIDVFTYTVLGLINRLRNSSAPVIFNYAQCFVEQSEMTFSSGAIAMIVVCVLFGLVMLCGTFYDIVIYQRRNAKEAPLMTINRSAQDDGEVRANGGTSVPYETMHEDDEEAPKTPPAPVTAPTPAPLQMWEKMLLAFSVYTNALKIIDTKQPPGRLNCLDGIRFLSMSWVILGHTYFFALAYVNNIVDVFPFLQTFTYQAILNATFSVDSFFVLSGLLTGYLFLKEAMKIGTINNAKFWVLYFFHRYWRLTPPYLLFLGFYTALLKYMTNGPLWNQTYGLDEPICEKYWWYNMLYVNNLVDVNKSCMGWAWYLANDMQFHYFVASIILPFIFFAMKYRRGRGWAVVAILVIVAFLMTSILSTAIISKVNHIPSTMSTNGGFDLIYDKPWCRVGAYVVGLVTAYFILEHQKGRFRLPKVVVAAGWIIATGTCVAVVYGLYGVNHQDYTLSDDISALYNAMSRFSWAVGLSWLIFACLGGYGGWINRFLSWPGFIPLSRLTYSAYLVHPVIMILVYGSSLQAHMVTQLSVIYWFFGHMIAAYLVAFVLTLTWESPLIGLERILLKK